MGWVSKLMVHGNIVKPTAVGNSANRNADQRELQTKRVKGAQT